jgi:hypothetical protein
MTTAIIEAKLHAFARDIERAWRLGTDAASVEHFERETAKAIASALADARRADVEVVRAFLRTVQELEPDEVTAALSRLAGET